MVKRADEPISKTQLDKLGEQLRSGTADDADRRALDRYRKSFSDTFDEVSDTIRTTLALEGTHRRAKTTAAIVDKLRRQGTRLTQIQDIAGLRLIVDGFREQIGSRRGSWRSFLSPPSMIDV